MAEGFDQPSTVLEKWIEIKNEALSDDIEHLERLISETRDGQSESPLTINLAGLLENALGSAKDQVSYMVDMAKVEALDLLGEPCVAFQFVDRYV